MATARLAALGRVDVVVARSTVERLMRAAGPCGVVRGKRWHDVAVAVDASLLLTTLKWAGPPDGQGTTRPNADQSTRLA